jgi:hypothetical protein
MHGNVSFDMLAQTLERLGIVVEIRDLADDDINIKSGLCEIGGRKTLIIDERLDENARTTAALAALRTQNMDNAYIPPAIRELLDKNEF